MGGGMTHHQRCLCASVYSIKADSVESAFFRVFFIMCPHHDACPCIPSLPVKVETQDFASHKRVFLNISARFNDGENMLSLLLRRKILRLTSGCSAIYPHVSMAVKICFHCSWDAKFCVSTGLRHCYDIMLPMCGTTYYTLLYIIYVVSI